MMIASPPLVANLDVGARYPVLNNGFKGHDLLKLPKDHQLLNLTQTCLRGVTPVISKIEDAHVTAFSTQTLFTAGDATHQALHHLAVSLFKGNHDYFGDTAVKLSHSHSQLEQNPRLIELPYNSPYIQEELKETALTLIAPTQLNDFSLLNFAKTALQLARQQMPAENRSQLPDVAQLDNLDLSIVLQKGNRNGASPHVDDKHRLVFTLAIPAIKKPRKNDTPVKQQNTLYLTQSHTYKHLPIGQALIMFPQLCRLIHSAPTELSESITKNPNTARYILSVSIMNQADLQYQRTVIASYGMGAPKRS